MLPVILGNNKGAQLAQNSQGLNGFWGRLAKKLIGMAIDTINQIPIVGKEIGKQIEAMVNNWTGNYGEENENSWWHRTGDLIPIEYEPTASEEAILTPWFETKFMPYYKKIVEDLNAGLLQSTVQAQASAINIAVAKMDIALQWHETNATAGLSKPAVMWRNDMMDELFAVVRKIISERIPAGFQVTMVASQTVVGISYEPLISGIPSNIMVVQYAVAGNNIPVLPPILEPPIRPTNPTAPTTPGVPAVQNPATAEKSFLQKYKVPLLAIGAVALLWPEEKKKKKE